MKKIVQRQPQNTPEPALPRHRPDIDGLRAFAILPVVLFHAGIGCRGGFAGVDVFFVISGFLIGGIIFRELDAGVFSFSKFWERRVRRIIPALLVFFAVTLVVGAKLMLTWDLVDLARQTVASLAGMANFKMMAETSSYWAGPSDSVWLLHIWSLAVEEQFYLIIPIILLVFHRWFRRRVFLVMLLLLAFSLGVSHFWRANDYAGNFYLLPSRAWELLLGCLGAWFLQRGGSLPRGLGPVAAFAGLVAIVISAARLHQDSSWPNASAFWPTIGTLLVLISPEPQAPASLPLRFLSLAPLRFIGLISYSMYLWHWPMTVWLRDYGPLEITLLDRWIVVAGAIVLGAASWFFVEQPFRNKLGSFRVGPKQLYLGLGAAWACLMFASVKISDLPIPKPPTVDDGSDGFKWLGISTITNYDARFHAAEGGIRVFSTNQPPRCVVVGTSHGMQLVPGIATLCRIYQVPCATFAQSELSALFAGGNADRRVHYQLLSAERDPWVRRYIDQWKPDLIILASKWDSEMEWRSGFSESSGSAFDEEFSNTVNWLSQRTKRLVVLGQIPTLPLTPGTDVIKYCWHHYGLEGTNLPRFEEPAQFTQARHAALEIFQRCATTNMTIIDPAPFFLLLRCL